MLQLLHIKCLTLEGVLHSHIEGVAYGVKQFGIGKDIHIGIDLLKDYESTRNNRKYYTCSRKCCCFIQGIQYA